MARRSNQKLKLLYLSKIFIEQTDDRNKLTLSQILDELGRYGVSAERKSVYDDIEALRFFGLDIHVSRDRYVRYYLPRGNALTDAKIVYDLLHASGVLGDAKVNELIKKFYPAFDPKEKMFLNEDMGEKVNDDVYKNISQICSAILSDKKLRFKQFTWNSRKQRILDSHGEYFCVSPTKLKYESGRYVLYAVFDNANAEQRIYVDRMINISVLNRKRIPLQDVVEFSSLSHENVRLRCANDIAGDVIDRFGINVTVLLNREEYFEVALKTALDESFYSWVFSKNGEVCILSPDYACERYETMIKKAISRQQKKDQ